MLDQKKSRRGSNKTLRATNLLWSSLRVVCSREQSPEYFSGVPWVMRLRKEIRKLGEGMSIDMGKVFFYLLHDQTRPIFCPICPMSPVPLFLSKCLLN